MRPYTELATDLANHTVAHYNFITPNLCNDMHDSARRSNNPITQGDTLACAKRADDPAIRRLPE